MHQPSISTIHEMKLNHMYQPVQVANSATAHLQIDGATFRSPSLRVLCMPHVCAYACTCVTFLAIWSLYVSLLLVSVFFLLNHHHLIYRYNHHICVSGAFVLVDGWKTLLVQTLPWTVQRCPQVTVTVPPHSTHFM